VSSFMVVGRFLGWKDGNGEVRVGVDAIMGFGHRVRLSVELIEFMQGWEIITLKYCSDPVSTTIWT
jgi:hypothetical protein